MKYSNILFLFILTLCICACSDQKSDSTATKDLLIKELISHNELERPSTKITVISTSFCKTNNCKEYFKDYKDEIQVFTVEDAFMRGIKIYTEITEVNEEEGSIMFIQKKNGKGSPVKLTLD